MTRSALLLLCITLLPAAAAMAQTSYSGGDTRILTPLSANDELRYRYGLPKWKDENNHLFIGSEARSKCNINIKSNVEFTWFGDKNQAVFFYSISRRDLVYEPVGGKQTARFAIFVRIRDPEKKIDGGFENVVTNLTSTEDLASGVDHEIVYRKIVQLPPGSFRADVTVRDIARGCRDRSSNAFTVSPVPAQPPRGMVFGRDPLYGFSPFRSSIVLGTQSDIFEKDPSAFDAPHGRWMSPSTTNVFRKRETIAVWFRLIIPIFPNCSTGMCPSNPDDVEYTIETDDGELIVTYAQGWNDYRVDTTNRVMNTFYTDSLEPGKYRIIVTVKQRSSGMTFSQSDVFRIIKPARVSPDK